MDNEIFDTYENFEIKKYFIAYFDILGYEEKVIKNDTIEFNNLLNIIKNNIKFAQNTMSYLYNSERNINIDMKVFSDNFIFWTEKDFDALILMVAGMQATFFPNNIFIRGSLFYGDLFIDPDFISGEGLIKAYKLEKEIAIFPRVIIDNSFFNSASEVASKLAKKEISSNEIILSLIDNYCNDFDIRFLDYLGIMKNYKYFENKDKLNKAFSFEKLLSAHADKIKINLKDENKRIVQKYQWCKSYHNEICKKYKYYNLLIE